MSRRGPSGLDAEFAKQDLIRMGNAARILGLTVDTLSNYVRAGQIKSGSVEWGGHTFSGVPAVELERLRQAMAAQ